MMKVEYFEEDYDAFIEENIRKRTISSFEGPLRSNKLAAKQKGRPMTDFELSPQDIDKINRKCKTFVVC